MYVKPKPGLKVREPVAPFAVLPPEGKAVPDGDPYWNRRIRSGDVERVEGLIAFATKTPDGGAPIAQSGVFGEKRDVVTAAYADEQAKEE
jgi:hypothetical protein